MSLDNQHNKYHFQSIYSTKSKNLVKVSSAPNTTQPLDITL